MSRSRCSTTITRSTPTSGPGSCARPSCCVGSAALTWSRCTISVSSTTAAPTSSWSSRRAVCSRSGCPIAPGVVDADGLISVITALAAGLGALHDAQVVHRDVKPANLLVLSTGAARDRVDRPVTATRRSLVDDARAHRGGRPRSGQGPGPHDDESHDPRRHPALPGAGADAPRRRGERGDRCVRRDRRVVEPPHRRAPSGAR